MNHASVSSRWDASQLTTQQLTKESKGEGQETSAQNSCHHAEWKPAVAGWLILCCCIIRTCCHCRCCCVILLLTNAPTEVAEDGWLILCCCIIILLLATRCTVVVLLLPLPMLSHHHIVAARCTSVVLLLPFSMLSHHIVATRCTDEVAKTADVAKSQGWYPFPLKLGCIHSKQKYHKAQNSPQGSLDKLTHE